MADYRVVIDEVQKGIRPCPTCQRVEVGHDWPNCMDFPHTAPAGVEQIVNQWRATLTPDPVVTDEDAEDLMLRLIANRTPAPAESGAPDGFYWRGKYEDLKQNIAWHCDGVGPDVPVLQPRYDALIAEHNRLRAELTEARAKAIGECVERLRQRIAYHESKDLHNGWTGDQSGPCCEKCQMGNEHFTGRADALKALVGCRNPFQMESVCQCHLPVRQAVKNGVAAVSAEFIRSLESPAKGEGEHG